MKSFVILMTFILFYNISFSQEMVYKPINPAFGGDTFNYQWLLSQADAQNAFEEKEDPFNIQTELEKFKADLNRQLLDKVTRTLFQNQFGEEDLTPGTYAYGSLILTITQTSEGLLVDILDKDTGDQTQILIPN